MTADTTPATPYWGRQTLYKGVTMRSRTEARFAALLDECSIAWAYEPIALAGPAGQWLPDFEIFNQGCRTFIDVKPTAEKVIEGIERWTTIASQAIADSPVRVLGAGYETASVWHEKALYCPLLDDGKPDVKSSGWRPVASYIETIQWIKGGTLPDYPAIFHLASFSDDPDRMVEE
jgi:hypothetical protein